MSDIDIIRAIKEKNNLHLQFTDQSKNTSKHLLWTVSLISIQILTNHIKLTNKFKM